MLEDNVGMYAYPFKGYWRDVGTIQSLWDANMDIIKSPETLDLADPKWKIYTNTMAMPPQYIGKNANVHRSMIADGCRIFR